VEFDHVVIAVGDLDAAAREFADRYGLDSVEGGRHPTLGTGNRIVPLADAYLELVTVVDPSLAEQNPFGRAVGSVGGTASRPVCWVVRTNELDEVARRNDLSVTDGSRTTPDGRALRWRMAGLDRAMAEPSLPFFIEWADGTPHPGLEPSTNRWRVAEIRLRGDAERLHAWLGDHFLPIALEAGEPAIASVVLAAGAETTVVDLAHP
jgi:hypothetical protein